MAITDVNDVGCTYKRSSLTSATLRYVRSVTERTHTVSDAKEEERRYTVRIKMSRVVHWLRYHIWFWFVFPVAWVVSEVTFISFGDRGIAVVTMSAAILIWWLVAIGVEWCLRERDDKRTK